MNLEPTSETNKQTKKTGSHMAGCHTQHLMCLFLSVHSPVRILDWFKNK